MGMKNPTAGSSSNVEIQSAQLNMDIILYIGVMKYSQGQPFSHGSTGELARG